MDLKDLGGFMNYLEKELMLGKRTIQEYLFVYRRFDPLKISQEYINEFVLEHKNTTIIRAFIKNYLEYHGISEMFTLPKKPKGRREQKVVRSISKEELEIIRSYFYNTSFKNGLILDLIYQGAMRRVEVVTISLGSFFWREWLNNPIDFCKLIILGKGKKQRIVLVNPETAEKIVNYFIKNYKLETMNDIIEFFNKHKDQLLFVKKNGNPLTERNIYAIIKENSIKALGRDIRPHELRHARATELERRGVPLRDIRNYLGHSKLATTEIYLHKTGEESTETIKDALKE